MNLDDFNYELPQNFIAQTPLQNRSGSKLLVYNRETNQTDIKYFYNIIDFLHKGDVLVINNTRVMPARLFGKKASGTKLEFLLLNKINLDTYEVLVKPMKRLKMCDTVFFDEELTASLISKNEVHGTAVIQFNAKRPIEEILERIGEVPLPHYITTELPKNNAERYQTVYNKISGSAAAPTAGLHWTPELMRLARDKGVIFCEVLLHVGLGTFRPVKCENIADHKMHAEYYEISAESAQIINDAKKEGRRVICVGTTSLRTLEGVYAKAGALVPGSGKTDIFIYPPYDFKVASALLTNFHLPKSTLLMLVSAFAGREKILELYETAKNNKFRFFSFGDCMFIC